METFALKPTIYFGENALSALSALAGRRVLVVTDAFLSGSGLLDKVRAFLTGGTVEVFDQVKPDPSLRLVAEGVRVLRAFQPDAVLAFGGGSPMDCAKAMVYFAREASAAPPRLTPPGGQGGRPGGTGPRPEHAAMERSDTFSAENVRVYCVPTTAGTGSEVTSFAVLTDTDRGVKYPLVDDALLPHAAVLDASLLAGVPTVVTADTGMDVLTHAAEAFVAKHSNYFTDALAERAFVLAYQNLTEAHRLPGESRAKQNMLLASCLAGIAFNAAGLGVNHSLAHALGGRYHVPHGRLNAMLMPSVISFNAVDERSAERYAHLAELCGLAQNARALSSALNRLRSSLGMPEKLTDCGVERNTLLADLGETAAAALDDACTAANPRPVTKGDLEELIRRLAGH